MKNENKINRTNKTKNEKTNKKTIIIGIFGIIMILILASIGAQINKNMQQEAAELNYYENYNPAPSEKQNLFPESGYSRFNYEQNIPGQERVGAKIGTKIGAKVGAKIGATIGAKVDRYGNEIPPEPEFPKSQGETYEIGQKLIKNARLDFTVENYDKSYDKIRSVTANAGGYISDSKEAVHTARNHSRKGGYVVIRIPPEKFNDVVSQIENIGNLTNKEINVQDVTQEYVDLSARLRNANSEEENFLKIMKNATTVEEMLLVEKEIGRVRGNIEQMQGQIAYMDERINFATIHINLQEPAKEEPYKPPEKEKHKWGIKDALVKSMDGFLGTTKGLIVIFGYLLPILIVIGIIYSIYKFRKR